MGKHHNNNKNKRIDFMTNTKTMGREGMRLIRNMAFGKFNFAVESHPFENVEFIKSTMVEVEKRIREICVHINAIQYAYGCAPIDKDVSTVLYRDRRSYEAYTLIYSTLQNIIVYQDVGILWVLISKLPEYRYNI